MKSGYAQVPRAALGGDEAKNDQSYWKKEDNRNLERNVEFSIGGTFLSSRSLTPPITPKRVHSTLLPPPHMSLSLSTSFLVTTLLQANHDAREIHDA
jgi:hypothetical protein